MALAGAGTPTDLLIMENGNTLIVADAKGLHPIDIAESASAEQCLNQGKVNQLMKLNAKTLENTAIYAGCFGDGSVRLYKDHCSEDTPSHKKVVEEEMRLGGAAGIKANSRKQNYTSGKGGANRII